MPSRRDVLCSLAGTGFGLGAMRLPAGVEAKGKHKHKHKPTKAKPNCFGCIDVGKACANAQDCCSGICHGKKGKKQCQVHGAGTCDQEADGFCEATDPEQTVCNDTPGCVCLRTTAGSQFCADSVPDMWKRLRELPQGRRLPSRLRTTSGLCAVP